jgi:hypothetical protein
MSPPSATAAMHSVRASAHVLNPDNRLVTAELERRWEQALRAVTEAEEAWRREQTQHPLVLTRESGPSREDVLRFMGGNICRCGTYPRIVAAIEQAAQVMKGGGK